MQPNNDFPREFLKETKAARLAYFTTYRVAHPKLMEVDEKLWQSLREPGDAKLICLFGPTGSGKTTVRERVTQRLLEQDQALMAQDPGYLPIASVDAVAPDSGKFSWRDYYKRALEALDDPFYGRSMIPFGVGVRWSAPEMRRALEKALKHRRVTTFIIDEAQHVTKLGSARKYMDQMNCLKSLAGITGTVHVLVGTYELLEFRNLSGQLTRRSRDIHFRRYKASRKEDRKAWHNLLWAFQRNLPLSEEPNLLGQWEFCYERSLGCVGILKDWLDRALKIALETDRHTIDSNLLEQTALSVTKCGEMAREISEQEDNLEESEEARSNLRKLLGLTDKAANQEKSGHQEEKISKPKHASGKVGQRKPGRDPIGGNQNESGGD